MVRMKTQVSAVSYQAERQVPTTRELLTVLRQHSGLPSHPDPHHPHNPHNQDSDHPQDPHDLDSDPEFKIQVTSQSAPTFLLSLPSPTPSPSPSLSHLSA